MLSKIKKWFRKIILKVEDKPFSKGYAECCVKCGATFKEGDNFIGVYYQNFVDLDLFGQNTADVYTLCEYVVSIEEPKVSVAICYDCFNKFINNKTIVYDGLDHVYTPNDFFRATSVSGWQSLPVSFVQEIKNRLGEKRFETLDILARKYKIFDQALFKNPKIFEEEASLESDKDLVFEGSSSFDIFAGFLNSLGRQLINQGYINDGKTILLLSLDIMPNANIAHVILAILYSENNQIEKAKGEAKVALKVIEELERREEAQNEFIPEEIKKMTPQDSYGPMRKMMIGILKRKSSK